MTNHDSLCQWANTPTHRDRAKSCPRCALIARIRADERERHGNNCRGMWDEWLSDLKDKVEALRTRIEFNEVGDEVAWVRQDAVLDLLGADDDG